MGVGALVLGLGPWSWCVVGSSGEDGVFVVAELVHGVDGIGEGALASSLSRACRWHSASRPAK